MIGESDIDVGWMRRGFPVDCQGGEARDVTNWVDNVVYQVLIVPSGNRDNDRSEARREKSACCVPVNAERLRYEEL